MKKIDLADKIQCTGCGACVSACPKSCIRMSTTGTIHNYPVVNKEDCIACGKCVSVCPPLNSENRSAKTIPEPIEQAFYAAWNKDSEIRKSATSGGVACGLYQTALAHGYHICGTAFDNQWHLRHVLSSESNDIEKFKGSKYLQSDTYLIFNEIKELINKGGKVLFVGTPCQVDALCRVVPENTRSQLITCAILCHGVNSPMVWEDFIHALEQKEKQKIVSYNFRSKTFGWGKLAVDYTLANGKKKVQKASRNQFHYWFGQHYMLRPSCIKCAYRGFQRYADITIGDFWGIKNIMPDLDTKEGISVLITSTTSGQSFVQLCKNIELLECDSEKTSKVLKGFLQKRSDAVLDVDIEKGYRFEQQYVTLGYDKIAQKYRIPSTLSRIINMMTKR